jgi:hypothetical protein
VPLTSGFLKGLQQQPDRRAVVSALGPRAHDASLRAGDEIAAQLQDALTQPAPLLALAEEARTGVTRRSRYTRHQAARPSPHAA